MIYVLTGDYRQFQNFMHEFRLREDFAGCTGPTCSHAGCKRGQVRYLREPADVTLAGIDHFNLVLAWGTWKERRDGFFVQDYCAARGITFLEVPETRREIEARRAYNRALGNPPDWRSW